MKEENRKIFYLESESKHFDEAKANLYLASKDNCSFKANYTIHNTDLKGMVGSYIRAVKRVFSAKGIQFNSSEIVSEIDFINEYIVKIYESYSKNDVNFNCDLKKNMSELIESYLEEVDKGICNLLIKLEKTSYNNKERYGYFIEILVKTYFSFHNVIDSVNNVQGLISSVYAKSNYFLMVNQILPLDYKEYLEQISMKFFDAIIGFKKIKNLVDKHNYDNYEVDYLVDQFDERITFSEKICLLIAEELLKNSKESDLSKLVYGINSVSAA